MIRKTAVTGTAAEKESKNFLFNFVAKTKILFFFLFPEIIK